MGLLCHLHAPVEQPPVPRCRVPDLGNRYEQVAADGPHLVLDVALLVAGIGVAEAVAEPVMGAAGLEQLGRSRRVRDAPADARRVVEDDLPRNPAEVLEDVAEGLADALGVLAGEELGEAHVREGEREREVAQAGAHAAQIEIGLAEVGLRLARRPRQIEVALAVRRPAGLRLPDIALHGADGHLGAAFRDQAVVDPLGGMALLAVVPQVVCEPLVDQGLAGVELGPP